MFTSFLLRKQLPLTPSQKKAAAGIDQEHHIYSKNSKVCIARKIVLINMTI